MLLCLSPSFIIYPHLPRSPPATNHTPVNPHPGLASGVLTSVYADVFPCVPLSPNTVPSVGFPGRASVSPSLVTCSCPPVDGFTPLMLASFCGGTLEPMPTEEDEAEDTSASIISDLICQGAQLGARTDRTGETALHLAARYARADAAKRLLDAGADTNAQDHSGRTPLHTAVTADAQGVFQVRWAFPFGLQSWDKHQIDLGSCPGSCLSEFIFLIYKMGYILEYSF